MPATQARGWEAAVASGNCGPSSGLQKAMAAVRAGAKVGCCCFCCSVKACPGFGRPGEQGCCAVALRRQHFPAAKTSREILCRGTLQSVSRQPPER